MNDGHDLRSLRATRRRAFIELNIATMLLAPAGVLGAAITVDVFATNALRCIVAACALIPIVYLRRQPLMPHNWRDARLLFLTGILLAGHWVFYFMALRTAGVAIGMISVFTHAVITASLEPLLFREKYRYTTIVSALLVVCGVGLLAPKWEIGDRALLGVGFGVLSAMCYSARNLGNRKFIARYDGTAVMLFQVVAVGIILSPSFLFINHAPSGWEWLMLLGLGVVGTGFGHTMFVLSLQHFPAATASVIATLQPIYGIALAWMFLHQTPAPRTLAGGVLVFSAVAFETFTHHRRQTSTTTAIVEDVP